MIFSWRKNFIVYKWWGRKNWLGSSTLWTTWPRVFSQSSSVTNKRKSFPLTLSITHGKIHIYSMFVLIRLLSNVCYESLIGSLYGGNWTACKILDAGFSWPTLFHDMHHHIWPCDHCLRIGNISHWNEMPQNTNQLYEVFDVCGIDFMGLFPNSHGYKIFLVAVDYMSRWVWKLKLYDEVISGL